MNFGILVVSSLESLLIVQRERKSQVITAYGYRSSCERHPASRTVVVALSQLVAARLRIKPQVGVKKAKAT
jgi:hypothetical protein